MYKSEFEDYKQKLEAAFVKKEPDKLKKVWIIKGDISGIQEYIFNVSSKGAAKALKARSYNVKEIENKYSQKVQDTLSDNWIKFCGGGGFLFITDDISKDDPCEIDKRLNSIQSEINNDLLKDDLSVRLTWSNGIDFSNAWGNVSILNNHKRYNLYNNVTKNDFESLFKPYPKIKDNNNIRLDKTTGIPFWSEDLVTHTLQNCSESFEINNVVKDGVIDFDGLAQQAMIRTGSNLLGVLKMDIDNLGKFLKGSISIKDYKLKSDFLNNFFTTIVEEIRGGGMNDYSDFEWKFKDNIYTVFSGGDDCFFIGGWDSILKFANEVKNKFSSEIDNNEMFKGVTISAGILIIDPKTPVVQVGRMAEEALSKAKSRKVNNSRIKDAICIMNEVFTWGDYAGILKHTDLLEKYLKDKIVKKTLLEKIKKSATGFDNIQQKIKSRKSLPFENVWRLKYYLRDIKNNNESELEEELFKPYQNALIDVLKINSEGDDNMRFVNPMRFPLAARLAELKTRNIKTFEYEQ